MQTRPISIIAAATLVLQLQSASAQNSLYGASIAAKPFMATEVQCLDALNAGRILGTGPDGRLIVIKDDLVFWIVVTPAYIDCETAQFTPDR